MDVIRAQNIITGDFPEQQKNEARTFLGIPNSNPNLNKRKASTTVDKRPKKKKTTEPNIMEIEPKKTKKIGPVNLTTQERAIAIENQNLMNEPVPVTPGIPRGDLSITRAAENQPPPIQIVNIPPPRQVINRQIETYNDEQLARLFQISNNNEIQERQRLEKEKEERERLEKEKEEIERQKRIQEQIRTTARPLFQRPIATINFDELRENQRQKEIQRQTEIANEKENEKQKAIEKRARTNEEYNESLKQFNELMQKRTQQTESTPSMRRRPKSPTPISRFPQHILERFPNIDSMSETEINVIENQLQQEAEGNMPPPIINNIISSITTVAQNLNPFSSNETQTNANQEMPIEIDDDQLPTQIDEVPIETEETSASGKQSKYFKNELPDFWY